jgi:hypothetical protein
MLPIFSGYAASAHAEVSLPTMNESAASRWPSHCSMPVADRHQKDYAIDRNF